ncbi:MAG: sulfotransferase [Planctomycetota bacterium]|nr:sulfotransferase [Planctomycetota bacterium]MDA1088467.1 sulfotransferase [Verrucomicrobiota bacterium]
MAGDGACIDSRPMLFPCGMSRSGTTLLATVLDSHSQVSLGYELIPPALPGPAELLAALDRGLKLSDGDFSTAGKALRKSGENDAGLFITRCCRAGIDADDTRRILTGLRDEGLTRIATFRERLTVAWRIAKAGQQKTGAQLFGFKLNIPSYEQSYQFFPGGYFIYILRDPRDVVASHREREFDRTMEEICSAWMNYTEAFEKFNKAHPKISVLVRYEDLVSDPRATIGRMFSILPIPLEEQVFRFYDSKATKRIANHPNAENLQKDFFSTSVARWEKDLSDDDVAQITARCGGKMAQYEYPTVKASSVG